MTMRSTRSLRSVGTAALVALALATPPGLALADHPAERSRDCASTESFWRDTADACAECAARLRQAEAQGAYRPAPPPREYPASRPAYPYRPRAAPPTQTYVQAVHREPPRTSTRAPGLLPTTAASAVRSNDAVARTLDPVVDPVLRETSEAVGTVAGTALGVALYPPFKVLEHVFGGTD